MQLMQHILIVLLLAPLTVLHAADPIDVGSRRELFVDAEIIGDRLEHTVSWKRGADVSTLAGKPIGL